VNNFRIGAALAALATVAIAGDAAARDQIRIVGSSTVFPFSTAVAEAFGRNTKFPTPVVESTGSGGGFKLFCAGVGADNPDITNASRRMKKSEFETCAANGVTEITEVVIGFDGIVIANAKGATEFNVTLDQVFRALVAGSTATTWADVDPSLPAQKIEVLGPPPTSGTRDAFEELAMDEGCKEANAKGGSFDCKAVEIRADGAYIEAGENDNLIVAKLEANPNALGVFGFSFLDQNADKIKGAKVNNEDPTFENIADGAYPLSRSLYFYVKKAHVGVIPGISEYVAEFVSDDATGEDGYLVDRGLIPLPAEAHAENTAAATELKSLTAEAF